MLLAIDIGNTNIVFGINQQEEWLEIWRIQTVVNKTADEYEVIFRSLFSSKNRALENVESVVISSVVPTLNFPIRMMVQKLFGFSPLFVGPDIYDKLPIQVQNPYQIGTDLVANSVSAHHKYKGSSIIVDMGTALTCTAISGEGKVLGVSISPGLRTAMAALSLKTAQLPNVELEAPPSVLGTNTIHAIQSGIVLGYKGLIESLIKEMKKEIATEHINVIATGGLSKVMGPLMDCFTHEEINLTLDGLNIIGKIISKNGN